MLYYRCKCGNSTAWGSMPPDRCATCDDCGSDLALGPDGHRDPTPHEFIARPVETDQGGATISRCRYCYLTAAEIEKRKQGRTP